jgi:hypothetical protein
MSKVLALVISLLAEKHLILADCKNKKFLSIMSNHCKEQAKL